MLSDRKQGVQTITRSNVRPAPLGTSEGFVSRYNSSDIPLSSLQTVQKAHLTHLGNNKINNVIPTTKDAKRICFGLKYN